jgi:adenine-specific DNA-methyltransferase
MAKRTSSSGRGSRRTGGRGSRRASTPPTAAPTAEGYRHPEATTPLRPDIGAQSQFKQKKPPATYTYDSSLSPALVWSGKAERTSFDVPTLPLFVHERLSTKAIIETLTGHRRVSDKQGLLWDLYGDPEHSIVDQTLKAYEHRDKWTNRLVLGDSLVVMNSLLAYENLGGQVQMIYMDPPYGVKFGSNFQPFVKKRDVKHNDDDDFTREPEMVQAYRDTWELGIHSYLTYLRDRLLLARELLTNSGSIFVQISDENLHHVREVMDEVFHPENFVSVIGFKKTGSMGTKRLAEVFDLAIWYARDMERMKYHPVLVNRKEADAELSSFRYVLLPSGEVTTLTKLKDQLPEDAKLCASISLTSQEASETRSGPFEFRGRRFYPPPNRHWSVSEEGMRNLASKNRIFVVGDSLRFASLLEDNPVVPLSNIWTDTGTGSFTEPQRYVVETAPKVVQRCLLMTTDPGDLVFDPTCGSGTTAYVAEQWGRRWITCDVSRVPLALARQRLLTATFLWYELKDAARGPAGGFVYSRKQNKRGEEVGGIVPHITLKSIANNEPPAEEVLVDRPEIETSITRVTGPFALEATIPTTMDLDSFNPEPEATASGLGDDLEAALPFGSRLNEPEATANRRDALPSGSRLNDIAAYTERMLEILRKSPLLRLEGNKTVALKNIRPPAKSLSLSAEALVNGGDPASQSAIRNPQSAIASPVAFVFGPENGAVTNRLVESAAKEANGKNYTHLYVIGFAIDAKARETIQHCESVFGIPATYVQATPDLLMGDLLKNMRSSQIFSVCGLPEVKIHSFNPEPEATANRRDALPSGSRFNEPHRYQVELLGLDLFDPITMQSDSRPGHDVPCWLLDTDYNGLCFHVSQAFFPRTAAWDNLKRALKGQFDDTVWDHLAGTTSAPFEPGEHRQVAVKVIDDRGNELIVVKPLP